MRFILSEYRHTHLARHFGLNDLVGGHFNAQTFPSPIELVNYINAHKAEDIISQTGRRSLYSFCLHDGRMAGKLGLVKRVQIPNEDIIRQSREGFTIEVGLVDELPETPKFCVIADQTFDGLSVVTAFPGSYARPFAQKNQPKDEFTLNQQFWEEHVLIKKK